MQPNDWQTNLKVDDAAVLAARQLLTANGYLVTEKPIPFRDIQAIVTLTVQARNFEEKDLVNTIKSLVETELDTKEKLEKRSGRNILAYSGPVVQAYNDVRPKEADD